LAEAAFVPNSAELTGAAATGAYNGPA